MTSQKNDDSPSQLLVASADLSKPIIYAQPMDVRFADLDPYGHVSTGRYLDLVIGSRFILFYNYFKIAIDELTKKDLGFFSSHLEIDFIRPIQGTNQVLAESSIQIIEPGKQKVRFELKGMDDGRVFARGFYIEHPVKISTKKPHPLPEWAYGYFFVATPAI